MFYAEKDNKAKQGDFIRSLDRFFLTDQELASLPKGSEIKVEATKNAFRIAISVPEEKVYYVVNENGKFTREAIAPRIVKNWMWMRIDKNKTAAQLKHHFDLMKECGISGVLFEGYDEQTFRLCHEAGLEAHYWKWTMNRHEVKETHPDWFAVNRKGESCFDKPAYVDYYRFLCPNHEGVAEYLAADYVKIANLPYVDGVH